MESKSVQQVFFDHIRSILPHHLSIVDEIARLLDISTDSAYRRMRGDKALSFEEAQKLCVHFNVSLDSIFHLGTDNYVFSGKLVSPDNFNFELYLKKILADIEMIRSFEKAEFYFVNKDVPLFHLFQIPELAAFKFFFFMKTILSYPGMPARFSVDVIPESLKTIGKKIAETYCQVSSTEIWNVECINTTLLQIDFYRDSHGFEKKEDLIRIYDCMLEMVDHVEKLAASGKKYPIFLNESWAGASYKLFNNEVFLGDNTILVDAGEFRICFINHSVINYMGTRNIEFCNHTLQSIRNVMQRSMMISSTGEKERFKFFNHMRENVNRRRKLAIDMDY